MKIRVSKREMASLLDAMLLKSGVQESLLADALETVESLEDDSGDKDRAIANAKKAIAALTGTKLEGCDDGECPGHLSKEAVRLCREALGGKEEIIEIDEDGVVRAVDRNTVSELRQKNEAQAVEMEAMRQEIERWKGEVLKDKERTYDLSDLQRQFRAGVEHGKRVRDREAAGEPAQPRSEPEAGAGATPSHEAPGEAATEPWKAIQGEHYRLWVTADPPMNPRVVCALVYNVAKEAYEAGLCEGRQAAIAQWRLGYEAAQGAKVPQKVHVIVAERTPPMLPIVWVFADNDRSKQEFDRLRADRYWTAVTYHNEDVRTEVVATETRNRPDDGSSASA